MISEERTTRMMSPSNSYIQIKTPNEPKYGMKCCSHILVNFCQFEFELPVANFLCESIGRQLFYDF